MFFARFLTAIVPMLCIAGLVLAGPARWEPEIRKFEEADRQEPPKPGGVVFVGSSSIRLWDTDRDFPGAGVVNRGFGGSLLADSVHYFDRIVLPHKPRTVVLYGGDNDIAAGRSAEQVAADYRRFMALMHEKLPGSRLVYLAIKPSPARWRFIDTQRAANGLIRQHAEQDPLVEYADTVTPMLDPEGNPRPELYAPDGLHLSPAGYELWTSLVRPLLDPNREVQGK